MPDHCHRLSYGPSRPSRLRARRRPALLLGVLGLLWPLLAAGCRDAGPGAKVFALKGTQARLRVAVLPFSSPASAPGAGSAVTATVITYLLSTGAVDVVEPGQVDKAMRAARFAPESAAGLDPDTLDALQQQLHVDAYLLGQVEEYGEVRVGPDTYPSISFSARLLRASDSTIVWAASISRTGADKVKVFDIGRVSSTGKLTKSAVAEMASSLRASSGAFLVAPTATATPGAPPAAAPSVAALPARPAVSAPTPGAKTFALDPLFAAEGRSFGQADLTQLLADVPGYSRGPVTYTKHAFDTVTALYSTEGVAIDVRLVDYQKIDAAKGFVAKESEGLQPEAIDSQLAFRGGSAPANPGALHLNIAAGRFGLYLLGPETAGEKMRQLAIALIQAK